MYEPVSAKKPILYKAPPKTPKKTRLLQKFNIMNETEAAIALEALPDTKHTSLLADGLLPPWPCVSLYQPTKHGVYTARDTCGERGY